MASPKENGSTHVQEMSSDHSSSSDEEFDKWSKDFVQLTFSKYKCNICNKKIMVALNVTEF